jgi:hypothetical protein
MTKTSRRARAAAAAAVLCCAGSAFAAGQFVPEVGLGYGSGGRFQASAGGTRDGLTLSAAFGYRFDSNLGMRAMLIGNWDPFDPIGPGSRTFDQFVGVQATAYVPLAEKVNFMGGLGLGDTRLKTYPDGDVHKTDGIVSAGLQVAFVRHYAMELRMDYLTQTHERNLVLTAQIPF